SKSRKQFRARTWFDQGQRLLQTFIGLFVSRAALLCGLSATERSGEIAVIAAGSRHGGVADYQISFDHDEIGAQRFGVWSLVGVRSVDRDEFSARFQALAYALID